MILRTGKTNLLLSRKGFTLVELMVSVVILGFGLDIIIRSYFSVLRGMDISRDYIEAARFSRQKIDALEVASYENNGLLSQSESGRVKLASREFNWQAEVKEIPQP